MASISNFDQNYNNLNRPSGDIENLRLRFNYTVKGEISIKTDGPSFLEINSVSLPRLRKWETMFHSFFCIKHKVILFS